MANKNSWQLTGSERIELVSVARDESTGQEQDQSVEFTYNPIVGFANIDQNVEKTQRAGPDESSFVKKRKKQLEYYKPKKNTKKNRRKYHKFDSDPDTYSGDTPDREDTRDGSESKAPLRMENQSLWAACLPCTYSLGLHNLSRIRPILPVEVRNSEGGEGQML